MTSAATGGPSEAHRDSRPLSAGTRSNRCRDWPSGAACGDIEKTTKRLRRCGVVRVPARIVVYYRRFRALPICRHSTVCPINHVFPQVALRAGNAFPRRFKNVSVECPVLSRKGKSRGGNLTIPLQNTFGTTQAGLEAWRCGDVAT
eukprot:1181733-Prorocentrum_minimum.AAC.1